MTKAYKVEAKDQGEVVATRYGGTAAHSKELRNELMEQFELKKAQVTIEDCDIPSDKTGLLEFINELAATADLVEGEAE